jgi:Phage tail lysozyme
MADWFIDGLVQRGMPQHVAEAFALNAMDESRMDPGINEIAPLVPGSRGGYGLMQWTGPRRKALEAFAAERGVAVSDPDLQLDFLVTELQGPEAGAAKAIYGAPDTKTAAAAIVNKFLRPAESNRAKREAAYLGGAVDYAGAPPQGNALASMPQQPQGQNALAQRPEFKWIDMTQDVTPFLRPTRNALAMG